MSVLIGHASIDERGQAKGGVAGDQNQKEVCIREWYSKPWSLMLRPINSTIAEKSAKACEDGCKNELIGYDQNQRNTLHTQALIKNYDLSQIHTSCETDCSAFMTVCAIAGGVKELEYTGNAPTTSTMANIFVKTGKYKQYTDSKYLTSDKYLQRGDILVKPGSHTVMVLSNGSEASTSSKNEKIDNSTTLSYPCRGIDVSSYQKNLNYETLKSNGVQFAILKIINKNNQIDSEFENHYVGFTKAGVSIAGVYNYVYATTIEAAKIAAQAVVRALNGRKLPVWMDVEDKTLIPLGHKLIDIINAYQSVIVKAGLDFGIYTGLSFYTSYLKPYINEINTKSFWIARYYNGYKDMSIGATLNDSKKPSIVGNLVGWQFTSSCQINGSNGQRLDANILYSPISKSTEKATSTTMKGKVTANSLRIRELPNTTSNTLGYLKKGEIVTIEKVDPATGWYKVGKGWASNTYITII